MAAPEPFSGDLVCWDFGDTLVDQTAMWTAPDGIPHWPEVYERCLNRLVDRWEVGNVSIRLLCREVAVELDESPARVWRVMMHNLTSFGWYAEVRTVVETLDGRFLQAIVTVNPHEFWGAAVGCGMHTMFDCIVTSADAGSRSKVVMAEEARSMLGLPRGLESTLLIDNLAANVDEFVAAGGQGLHFVREEFAGTADALFPS